VARVRPPDEPHSEAPTRVAVPGSPPPAPPAAVASGAGIPDPETLTTGPLRVADTARSAGQASSVISVATAHEALHHQEIARTRVFARLVAGLVALLAALLPFLGGDPLALRFLWAGVVATGSSALWLLWTLQSPARWAVWRVLVFGFSCIYGGFCAIYYFGVFSPAVALMPVGIYFFTPGQSERGAVVVYAAVAAAQGALMLVVIAGLLPDHGLVRGDALPLFTKLVVVVLLEGVYLVTFVIGRATRKATLDAIALHDRAVHALGMRDALLAEARADLDRALQAGGLGRHSGQTVGSFELGALIGRGGMGEVYEATHRGTGEAAAVKLLGQTFLAEPESVRRFLREARVVASLQVPNVVRVIEVGGLAATLPYIAMERLRGEDLAEVLRARGRVSVRYVVDLLRQVGAGLAAAHAAGIVHRDLKPRNLFLAGTTWKILDFGVSKLLDPGATVTHENVVGTPAYMSPEQASGEAVTARSDLFALGAVAYRALTGRPAFTGSGTPQTLYQVVHAMPPRPGEGGAVGPEVDLVLAVALAKSPDDRFADAAALADALEDAAQGRIAEPLRARAERLLARRPWGTRP